MNLTTLKQQMRRSLQRDEWDSIPIEWDSEMMLKLWHLDGLSEVYYGLFDELCNNAS